MRTSSGARLGQSGYSLVEVLIATLLFFMIAIGVIPLFSRAMVANRAGADSTAVSLFGLSRLEELLTPPFDSNALEPGVSAEYFSARDKTWKAGSAPTTGDPGLWIRSTTITQHSLNDLESDGVFDEPLPTGSDPAFTHLKLIEVRVGMVRESGNPLGRRRDLDLRVVRPY